MNITRTYQMIKISLLNIIIKPKKFYLLLILSIWCLFVVQIALYGNKNYLQQQQIDLYGQKQSHSNNNNGFTNKFQATLNNKQNQISSDGRSHVINRGLQRHQHQEHKQLFPSLSDDKLSSNDLSAASPLDTLNVMRDRRSSGRYTTSGYKTTSTILPKVKVLILVIDHEKDNNLQLKYNSSNELSLITIDKLVHFNHNLRLIIDILESEHIEFTIDTTRHGMPNSLLINQKHSGSSNQHEKIDFLYPIIIVDDLIQYSTLNRWLRDQIDRHCRMHNIGMIGFFDYKLSAIKSSTNNQHNIYDNKISSIIDEFPLLIEGFPLYYKRVTELQLQDYQLNPKSSVPRILKSAPDLIMRGHVPPNVDHAPWFTLSSDHVTYELISQARIVKKSIQQPRAKRTSRKRRKEYNTPSKVRYDSSALLSETNYNSYDNRVKSRRETKSLQSDDSEYDISSDSTTADLIDMATLVMADHGLYDGIRRVIFGGGVHFWYHRALLLDSIGHLSNGKIISSLDRYIQIDIDDIFVGEVGTRMKLDDVNELVEAQRQFNLVIDGGFKFNLGYSGKYFLRGNDLEDEGDKQLIKLAGEFNWFCHTWGHSKAHLSDISSRIERELILNQQFAGRYNLPIINTSKEKSILRNHHQSRKEIVLDQRKRHVSSTNYSSYEFNGYIKKNNDSNSKKDDSYEKGAVSHNSTTLNASSSHHSSIDSIKNEATTMNYNEEELILYHQQQTNRPSGTYSVAPHHSGVFPIHEPLYEAWKKVLNVQVTTTEEYPHLRPAKFRKGFIYKDIMVLPRQTCGLYTHTIFMDKYPGGKQKLDASIQGGELFQTILHNPVSIFMTHLSNYGNDRLALYTFASLINFIMKWTNINLKYTSNPIELARYYFEMRPNEANPIWSNPCHDKRHVSIWSKGEKWCQKDRLPKFLIVGPQKTGTTALHTFLQLHPMLKTSKTDNKAKFEEIQFFNSENYLRGLDWYIGLFSHHYSIDDTTTNNSNIEAKTKEKNDVHYYFEKSATYFDDPVVPERAHALLPNAKIVMIFIDPIDRAYSWYQHMRAHGDKIATSFTFNQIITATDDNRAPKRLLQLRSRCLNPGHYSSHLQRWLAHYPSDQVIVIDGHWFRQNPSSVINRLQAIIDIKPMIDFDELLVYDKKKGFFCQTNRTIDNSNTASNLIKGKGETNNRITSQSRLTRSQNNNNKDSHVRCLGKGKGRKYLPMDKESRLYLRRYYMPHNRQLASLLSNQLKQPLPVWLDDEISFVGSYG